MRLHRFYVRDIELKVGGAISVTDAEKLHQWKNVFRLNVGDDIVVFNGAEDADYVAQFVELSKTDAKLEVAERRAAPRPGREVDLYLMLFKKERFEWVVEKVTELGVGGIHPVISERTEVKSINAERTEKIIAEAVEQSGRCRVPALGAVMDLKAALEQAKNPLICDIEGTLPADQAFSFSDAISIFIGPEGGWSPAERALFLEKKLPAVSFGAQTLRAETAAIVATTFATLKMGFPKTE